MNTNSEASSSTSQSPSRIASALGFFKKSKTPSTLQQVPRALPTPPPAAYVASHERQTTPTALDDFFGAGALEAHRPVSYAASSRSSFGPPPYAPYGHAVVETSPGMYAVQEPPTLARMLFLYGFIFFPFWIVGVFVLFSPLRPTEDWEAGKSEDEKSKLLVILRDTEKKWARRCLYAMSSLLVILALIIVIVKFGVLHSH
ncbi:hypothetical protein BU17DRAFT_38415 [Hysterangium stoloniferum]|nr:hypothetical protein BU17DRAFT_38415 [Hysterangium stoloniferum]